MYIGDSGGSGAYHHEKYRMFKYNIFSFSRTLSARNSLITLAYPLLRVKEQAQGLVSFLLQDRCSIGRGSTIVVHIGMEYA